MQRIAATCPHDCPSVCALEVERIDSHTIGGVYGSKSQTYTDGVICAKVARYKDRIHHPQRLTQPLRRIRAKGLGTICTATRREIIDDPIHSLIPADRLK